MKTSLIAGLGAGFVLAASLAATQDSAGPGGTPGAAPVAKAAVAATPVTRGICTLAPRSGSEVSGFVKFLAEEGGVRVEAEIKGLKPGRHGFHVHEWGDLDCTDGKCTGGHFNPTGAPHGAPEAAARHLGDLGNLEADASGVAKYSRLDTRLQLNGPQSIIGRAIIVHADADDFTTQPTGNAGDRIAAGVIGIGDPGKK